MYNCHQDKSKKPNVRGKIDVDSILENAKVNFIELHIIFLLKTKLFEKYYLGKSTNL